MSDIKELLKSWGNWANDHQDDLGCKSPSEMLIKSAPHADSSDKPVKRVLADYISDEDALMVDKAVGKLARHSVLLWAVLRLHYQYGWSVRKIAIEHLSELEYPCGTKQSTSYSVSQLLERATGVIEGCMIDTARYS